MLHLISGKDHNNHFLHVLYNEAKAKRHLHPLATRNITMQQRSKLKQALLDAVSRKRWQKEMQIAFSVERCQQLIETQVNAFIVKESDSIAVHAVNILAGKAKVRTCLFQEMLSPIVIDKLLNDIKHNIQMELKQCFGAVSVDIAAFHYNAQESGVIKQLAHSVDEYRNTLLLAEVATELSDKAWESALGKLAVNPLLGKLLKKLKLGTVSMKLAGCDHQVLLEQCCRQLTQELSGILLNITHKIKMLARNKVSKLFYEMYDNTYGREFTNIEHNIKRRDFRKTIKYNREPFNQQAV